MTTNEKIAALRAAAQAAGAHGVLLMTSDPHSSEYLPAYYNNLPFFSGFTGENSTLVVNQHTSALWCDGRFYVRVTVSWPVPKLSACTPVPPGCPPWKST